MKEEEMIRVYLPYHGDDGVDLYCTLASRDPTQCHQAQSILLSLALVLHVFS